MGQRREAGTLRANGAERRPVQNEARRWRLECDRRAGDRRPDIPERERLFYVGVLHRPAVPRDPRPDGTGIAVEIERDEARMPEDRRDTRPERAELEDVAAHDGRRRRAILGAGPVVAVAEEDGLEAQILRIERGAARQADLDRG